MSTSTPTRPPGDDAAGPEQDTRGRAENFGLNVRRLRRVRLIVFAILALPILLLALLTVKFVSMPLTQAWHQAAYSGGEYDAAIERLAPVQVANWFEPYLPHLSEGTDLLQQGDNAAAEEELRTSLQEWEGGSDLNQPLHAQCKIINNLAIAIERQADEIEDPAERADRLYEAEELLAPCAGGGGGGEGQGGQGGDQGEEQSQGGTGNEDSETTEDNGERVEEKRREADEQAGDDPDERGSEEGGGDGQDPGEGESPMDPGDPRREDPEGDGPEEEAPTEGDGQNQDKEDELEQRNRDAQEGEGEDDTGGSDQEPSQPW